MAKTAYYEEALRVQSRATGSTDRQDVDLMSEDGADAKEDSGEGSASPKEVGHNIYILAHQLARHNKELAELLKPSFGLEGTSDEALEFYANHTAQIEVSSLEIPSSLYNNSTLFLFINRLFVWIGLWSRLCSPSLRSANISR